MTHSPPKRAELRFDGARAIRLLDAAYQLDAPDDLWLDGLLAEVAPCLDDGTGVHAFLADLEAGTLTHPRLHGGEREWRETWRETWWDSVMAPMDRNTLRGMASFGPLSYTRDLWSAAAQAIPTFELLLDRVGALRNDEVFPDSVGRFPDSLNLIAVDVSGKAVGFCASRAARSSAPPQRTSVELGGLLSAHIASAIRLRARQRSVSSALDAADALLSDSGDVIHVREGAQLDPRLDALRHAARSVVRSKVEADGDATGMASLALWQVLFARTFSVVDVFDRDGRRYLVANRNRPKPRVPLVATLTTREQEVVALVARGHSNKLIAYELDIGPSAVANHLASAARKLRLGSSRQLIMSIAGGGTPSGDEIP